MLPHFAQEELRTLLIRGLFSRTRRAQSYLLVAEESNPLIDNENKLGEEATLAIPTPDHYLPFLYVIGTRTPSELVTFPVEGVDGGSISMLAVQVV